MNNKILFFLALIFSFTYQTNAATFNVTVPAGTNECWLAGNFKLIQGTTNWDAAYYRMIKIDNTHYTIDISDAEITLSGQILTNIRYKYLSGPSDWAYVEKNTSGNEIDVRTYTTGNDIVAQWGVTYTPSIEIRVYTPKEVSNCYITGNFNNWAKPGNVNTNMNINTELSDSLGNLFYTILPCTDPSSLVYKFAAGKMWDYLQTNENLIPKNYGCISYHDTISFKRIYNISTLKTVRLNVSAPLGTNMIYLMGNNVSWNGVDWLQGTKNENGTFSFTVNNVDLLEYNYYNAKNWSKIESDNNSNPRGIRLIDAQLNTTANDTIAGWEMP